MRKIMDIYKYFSDKRFSTVAGTLVYFLLMSLAPFILWLTLIFGDIDIENFLSYDIFSGIGPFISELKNSAGQAAGGAGFFLLITTLYSSTNFFYHMRRSGEIIYSCNRTKGGIKLRLASLALIFAAMLLMAVSSAVLLWGGTFLKSFMPEFLSDGIVCFFIAAIALLVCIILNLFTCPYKIKVEEVLTGSLLTTVLWGVLAAGFTVYLYFASPEKLYGRIASLIVFLLWCYLMMNSYVIGVICNAAFKRDRRSKSLF